MVEKKLSTRVERACLGGRGLAREPGHVELVKKRGSGMPGGHFTNRRNEKCFEGFNEQRF